MIEPLGEDRHRLAQRRTQSQHRYEQLEAKSPRDDMHPDARPIG